MDELSTLPSVTDEPPGGQGVSPYDQYVAEQAKAKPAKKSPYEQYLAEQAKGKQPAFDLATASSEEAARHADILARNEAGRTRDEEADNQPYLTRLKNAGVGFAKSLVTDPLAIPRTVGAPVISAYDAAVSPSVGEQRPNIAASKGGASGESGNAGLPHAPRTAYDAAHGGITDAQRREAGVQVAATGLAGPMGFAAAPVIGAAYMPEDPLVGAGLGAVAHVAHGAVKDVLPQGVESKKVQAATPFQTEWQKGAVARHLTDVVAKRAAEAKANSDFAASLPVEPPATIEPEGPLATRVAPPAPAPQQGPSPFDTTTPTGFQPNDEGVIASTAGKPPKAPAGLTHGASLYDEYLADKANGKTKSKIGATNVERPEDAVSAETDSRRLSQAVTPDPELIAAIPEEIRQEELTRQAALRALTGVKRRPGGAVAPEAETAPESPPEPAPVPSVVAAPEAPAQAGGEPLPSHPEGYSAGSDNPNPRIPPASEVPKPPKIAKGTEPTTTGPTEGGGFTAAGAPQEHVIEHGSAVPEGPSHVDAKPIKTEPVAPKTADAPAFEAPKESFTATPTVAQQLVQARRHGAAFVKQLIAAGRPAEEASQLGTKFANDLRVQATRANMSVDEFVQKRPVDVEAAKPSAPAPSSPSILDQATSSRPRVPRFAFSPAAIQLPDGTIFNGRSHFAAVEKAMDSGALPSNAKARNAVLEKAVEGFVDEHGRFMSRDEGYEHLRKLGAKIPKKTKGEQWQFTTELLNHSGKKVDNLQSPEPRSFNQDAVPARTENLAVRGVLDELQKASGAKNLPRITAIDKEAARRMAHVYNSLPENDPHAKAAYDALNREIAGQKMALEKAGFRFEYVNHDPYKNSAEMMQDVRENRRLKVYKAVDTAEHTHHPYMTAEQTNDFRGVHDLLAHAGEGHQFGPIGEENAYRVHASTLSPEAQQALASETRGQNSWVNFGPNERLPVHERPFAQQKAALWPKEYLVDYSDMPRHVIRGPERRTTPRYYDQVDRESPRGRITFGDDGIRISLFKSADATTVIHELGHAYLNTIDELGAEKIGDYAKDRTTVREWLGAEGDEPLTREQHEQFARAYEQWHHEGVAPTPLLARVFERFKQWMTEVYGKASETGIDISPEVRDVFRRLSADDNEHTVDTESPLGGRESAGGGGSRPTPVGTPRDLRPDETLLNRAKFSPDAATQRQLAESEDALLAKGKGKTVVSIADGLVRAREFARQVGLDPLRIDGAKAARFSGEDIVGLRTAAQNRMSQIAEMSRQLASATTPAERTQLAAAINDAVEARDRLLDAVAKGGSQLGRDLNFLKQMADYSLDPDVWEMNARRMAKGRILSDDAVAEIRRLALEAKEICGGG